MSTRRGFVRRTFVALATVVALVGGVGVATSVESTDAAWTDQVTFSAPVTAGTWGPSLGCVWYAGGVPQPGVSCTVTSLTITSQWGTPGDRVRNYNIVVSTSGPTQTGFARLTIDRSTATGGGAWSWGNAATVADGGHFTPLSGYACSELPILRADGPTWGASGSTYYFRVIEHRSSPGGETITCS